MSDFTTRARALTARYLALAGGYKPIGDTAMERVETYIDLIHALGHINPWAAPSMQSKEWSRVLFDVTVLSGDFGIDIVDGIQSAIEQRELAGRKPVPGTLAPVPNAKTNDGTLRDPSGTEIDRE